MPILTVIVGSIRPGRAAQPIAEWFTDRVRAHGGFDVEVADLAEIRLPLMEEPNHPRLRRYTFSHTHEWSARIDRADAVVFVTPEYNYGYPATIKNAIDYLHQEWKDKPAGFVSYGGVAAGTRAVQQLRQVITTVKMVPVLESVNIPFHSQLIEDGKFHANDVLEQSATAMLDELLRLDAALRPLRAEAAPAVA
ncbi:MAG TPA: NAD(P)H-dependent oxidoreductase [Trebonia sp.]|jgi:NAD(P)H-dependent FMN reductase|nr:NAD(P)H-dependent oxidoreductase [Trebonia sp.]